MTSSRVALRTLLDFCRKTETELAEDIAALLAEQCCQRQVSRCANCHRLSRQTDRTIDEWCFYGSLRFSLEHATQLLGDTGGSPYDILDD